MEEVLDGDRLKENGLGVECDLRKQACRSLSKETEEGDTQKSHQNVIRIINKKFN